MEGHGGATTGLGTSPAARERPPRGAGGAGGGARARAPGGGGRRPGGPAAGAPRAPGEGRAPAEEPGPVPLGLDDRPAAPALEQPLALPAPRRGDQDVQPVARLE